MIALLLLSTVGASHPVYLPPWREPHASVFYVGRRRTWWYP